MTAIKQKNDQAQAIVVGYTQSEIDALPAIIGKREVARIACVSERPLRAKRARAIFTAVSASATNGASTRAPSVPSSARFARRRYL